jgi:hypothetical protein
MIEHWIALGRRWDGAKLLHCYARSDDLKIAESKFARALCAGGRGVDAIGRAKAEIREITK